MRHALSDRRTFLAGVAASLTQATNQALRGSQAAAAHPVSFRLEREFKATQFKAMSPDGSLLCLNRGTAIRRYRANFGGPFRKQSAPTRTLVLVAMGSWRENLVRPLPDAGWSASFQSDGGRLLVNLYLTQIQRRLISLPSHESVELSTPDVDGLSVESELCDIDRVLQHERPSPNLNAPKRDETLRLIELTPNGAGREVAALPAGYFSPNTRALVQISLNRGLLLHSQGYHRIVCRSTRTLEERWSYPVANDFEVAGLGISPNGEFVVCNLDGREPIPDNEPSQQRQSIRILDGATGALRHQIDRKRDAYGVLHAIAITNDGSLIAIESESALRWNGKGVDETLVQIIEAKTGRLLQTLLQCETRDDDRLASGITELQFTPDGQSLVSSGESTRIWKKVAGS
jgi:hypothetical protein